VDTLLHVTSQEGIPLVLCHYAMRTWNRSHYGAIQLYGHSHGNLPGDSQSCDVGVDCWGFRPVSLEEILNNLIYNEHRYEQDHHQPKGEAV
jgi:calcineurin-like phosphoesterase family protein